MLWALSRVDYSGVTVTNTWLPGVLFRATGWLTQVVDNMYARNRCFLLGEVR